MIPSWTPCKLLWRLHEGMQYDDISLDSHVPLASLTYSIHTLGAHAMVYITNVKSCTAILVPFTIIVFLISCIKLLRHFTMLSNFDVYRAAEKNKGREVDFLPVAHILL